MRTCLSRVCEQLTVISFAVLVTSLFWFFYELEYTKAANSLTILNLNWTEYPKLLNAQTAVQMSVFVVIALSLVRMLATSDLTKLYKLKKEYVKSIGIPMLEFCVFLTEVVAAAVLGMKISEKWIKKKILA